MREYLSEFWARRELLFALTWKSIRVRYKQSIMGILWALFIPMVIVGSGVFLRVAAARYVGDPVALDAVASVAVKSLFWSFFLNGLGGGTNSLQGNMSLVTKIYFPKIIFPLSAILSGVLDLLVAGVFVAIGLMLMGVAYGPQALWVPLLFVILTMLVFGITGILSVLNLFFRDVKYIVNVITSFAIFFTPVFYEASLFGEWRSYIMLNPVAPVLEALRFTVVLNQPPEYGWLAYSTAIGVVTTCIAVFVYQRVEPIFAENI